ncbi:hypothetical protein DFJ77DRAFT_51013 [Powellomyces hirtus]|nr:hypothetical protein DFJ77DRAFT_51013 [Powellomyces hirtus]
MLLTSAFLLPLFLFTSTASQFTHARPCRCDIPFPCVLLHPIALPSSNLSQGLRVSKDWSAKPENQIVDLAHVENGGRAGSFSNAHYGHPRNLIAPGRSLTMAGGWETARNPDRPRVYVTDPLSI